MHVPLSSDHLCWDNTEPVTYLVSSSAGKRRFEVAIAKGRNVRGREKSPSGGAYAGYERNWHLPQREIPEGEIPKPGDVIVDGDGNHWTALTAEWDRAKQRWQMGCVNLVLALDLRETIAIERAAVSYDTSGAVTKTFPPAGGEVLYTLAARVQWITDDSSDERGARYAKGHYDVIVGSQVPKLDLAEDRVNWTEPGTGATIYLDVIAVRNPERIDELPVLTCERRR